ncbi:Copper methylamine oxidase [Porphyridium purpureum]|uniref:Amine oxidase n=1 Tax=Porphyridium purpureum TaxID=35688 RepID=A0A5J4YVW4_PORPP|nr:Copper methylamine oxidase [Porphyridium purpureum]|eukprot:POR6513..scf227_4
MVAGGTKMMGAYHPLDDLSAEEVRAVVGVVRQHAEFTSSMVFNAVTLREPPKSTVVAFDAQVEAPIQSLGNGHAGDRGQNGVHSGAGFLRSADCITLDYADGRVFEWVVTWSSHDDVQTSGQSGQPAVVSCTYVPDKQPMYTPEDCITAESVAKSDAGVVAVLNELGFHDMELVAADPWSMADETTPRQRTLMLFLYAREFEDDNHYAHPINILPVVDLVSRRVIEIRRPKGGKLPPIPKRNANYMEKFLSPEQVRRDLKPLEIIQPDGPSFTVKGRLVTWQNWSFRVGFNCREGLVMRDVRYRDGQELRRILYRGSCSEMIVPYGDPQEPYHLKAAKDVGDYGLGYCASSLSLGCDCLGTIHYMDAVLNNHAGDPVRLPNAVCIHEEDAGLLWKHVDYRTGKSETRRSRRLIVQCTSTVVNYEYLTRWIFQQDGTIHVEMGLTGMLSTNQVNAEGEVPEYGTLVMDGLNAQLHQHMFNFRLDMAVDGFQNNQVIESDVVPVCDPSVNVHGNAFRVIDTPLLSEQSAIRDSSPERNRVWKIVNTERINPVTRKPVGYKLVASTAGPLMLANSDCAFRKQAPFATHNLWVTRFDEKEYFAGGKYPSQANGEDGLHRWTERNASLDDDIVMWHTFGVTHVPRPEDFPVMPLEVCGFSLKPFGFFTANPGNDVPVTKSLNSSISGAQGMKRLLHRFPACSQC